jgi:hypothetical protein
MNKNISNIFMEQCKNYINSEEFKKEFKNLLEPLFDYFFKEISIYLFFFVFFILTSFLLHLGILILLIRYNNNISKNIN